jgi:hypothetical protein
VEAKVRQLLGRTELKEIANTARVLVEISEEPTAAGIGLLTENNSSYLSPKTSGLIA